MENIFISTDWHLYSDDTDEGRARHPYKSRLDLVLLKDNVGKDMTPADLWLYLGDLCDPKQANRDIISRILQSIPARKVLVRGNHDTEDDQWYLDLGFDQVTEGVVIHNMLFTHVPQSVPEDWINVHGHIHFEKIAMDGTHINAYATNWNDACHPVLLEDLLHGAKVQKVDLNSFKEEKYRKYFERSMNGVAVDNRLDLTDEFNLYPVDEAVGISGTLDEIIEFNRELGDWAYGVWDGKKLIKNPKDKDYADYVTMGLKNFEKAKGGTCWDYVPYEIGQFAKRWPSAERHAWNIYFESDKSSPSHAFMTFRVGHGGWMLFEASDKTHRGIWCGSSENEIVSQCFLWLAKANHVDINKTKGWATKYAPLESKWFGIKPQEYMDLLTKSPKLAEWNIDTNVELVPYGGSMNENVSLIEAILFPNVDTTQYFEADDNEYKRKAQKAEVDQDNGVEVTLDEQSRLEADLQADYLYESAAMSKLDPNHKQNGTIDLSNLKMVEIDAAYLKKHGKKGALKDASACGKYCKSVAWELDGKPIVSVAVGYPNKAEREPGDDYNWIGNLLVDDAFRGYGLGKQALDYAITKLGGDALAVRGDNEVAIDIYKKRGFKTSKDSARAVANKHANYYQMYLHEDIGTAVGDLN